MNRTLIPAILAAAFIAVGGLVIACDSDDDDPATVDSTPTVAATATPEESTATPEASPATPTPEAPTATPEPGGSGEPECPIEDVVCNIGESLSVALEAGDYEAIVDLIQARDETCPGTPPQGAGGPYPLCEGAPQGEVRAGYVTARRYSEGAMVDRDGVLSFLETFVASLDPSAIDDYGDGGLSLEAVSCAQPGANACERATVIFGGIDQAGGARVVLVFWIPLPADPETPIAQVWDGVVQPQELDVIFETGGNLFDLGEVYVLEES